jgi:hypothetical protein
MMVRSFVDEDFHHVGRIEPGRGSDGEFLELMPQSLYRDAATIPLHACGAGPFCRFRVGRTRREPGLYVLTVDDKAFYAGECVDLFSDGDQTATEEYRPAIAFVVANRRIVA